MATSAPGVTRLRYRGLGYEVVRGEGGRAVVLRRTRHGKIEVKGRVAFAVAQRALRGRVRSPSNRSRTLRGAARKARHRSR